MKKNVLFIVLALFEATAAFAQERIAVFPFEVLDNAITRNNALQFYQAFSNEFRNKSTNSSAVVPRLDVDKLFNTEAEFQLSNFSAQEKTAEMMRVQNATQIISGKIGKVENRIIVTVSLYTYPELEQLHGGANLLVVNTTELFNKIPELVQKMQNEMTREDSREEPIPYGLEYEFVGGRSPTITITGYKANSALLNIPAQIESFPVTAIGKDALRYAKYLTSVTIPSTVTAIGEWAFTGLTNLTNVTIPPSVTSIGEGAFMGCTSLTSIYIPSSVTTIGRGAFLNCGLITINVDSSSPYYTSRDGVLFDKNIRTLRVYPASKKDRFYTIPSSVASIGEGAFSDCTNLTSITIPSSVSFIGEEAFSDCTSLTSIIIPSSVSFIGFGAFWGCINMTSVTLSRRTKLGENAFPETARIRYRD